MYYKKFVRQISYLPELYEDVRSEKYKKKVPILPLTL